MEADLPAICAVYAHYVATSAATFDLVAPSLEAWGERLQVARRTGRPWRVAEVGGAFAGYATASEYRPRLAYRSTVETTVYLQPGLERRGLGRALYGELLRAAGDAGFRMAVALIPLPNPASVGVHEALGFEPVGVMREVGYKLGAWRDVGTWQLRLDQRDPGAG